MKVKAIYSFVGVYGRREPGDVFNIEDENNLRHLARLGLIRPVNPGDVISFPDAPGEVRRYDLVNDDRSKVTLQADADTPPPMTVTTEVGALDTVTTSAGSGPVPVDGATSPVETPLLSPEGIPTQMTTEAASRPSQAKAAPKKPTKKTTTKKVTKK